MNRAVLFDLDDTLMVEEPAAEAAFLASAEFAAGEHGVNAEALAVGARKRARELWYAAPTHDYCMRVGISSWEGLWCRFEGDQASVRALRRWSSTYRREAWRLALADQGIENMRLSEELAERFVAERRARHQVFSEVPDILGRLAESYSIALVTNGASCLQREKLAASGLDKHFKAVVVSADLGIAKPDASVFQHALSELDIDDKHAVMVGDSLSKDVGGAVAAGLRAVWVNRSGRAAPQHCRNLVAISTLHDLPSALEEVLAA